MKVEFDTAFMKRLITLLPALLLLSFVSFGQEANVPVQGGPSEMRRDNTRGDMIRELGLSPDQMRQMRRLNMERKPLMEAAQRRLREANRLLDEAIYADAIDESNIQLRLDEAQAAQGEVFRIRSTGELSIRRILNPEQLVRFREIRKRFEEQARENMQMRKEDRMRRGNDPGPATLREGLKRPRRGSPQEPAPKH